MKKQPLILFDGVCNLCNNTVLFVIRHDSQQQFYFTSLQSETGLKITGESGDTDLKSILLLDDDRIYRKSSAVLRILKILGGPWSIAYLFILIPPLIRDSIYDFIGQRRYRWFGKKTECWLPDDSIKSRFLD